MRVLRARPRLFLAALIGLVIIVALPADWRIATRLLAGWDAGIALYLAAAYEVMTRADVAHIRRQAVLQDEGRTTMLVLTVLAALASLGAIVAEIGKTHAGDIVDPPHLLVAVVTIVLSWAFIHTIFALHYAHGYYVERNRNNGGLAFPGGGEPDYWDFVYFSFVIGMTSQVSDVGITSKSIRRAATAHGVVSFLFNVALLALMVNIAANAI